MRNWKVLFNKDLNSGTEKATTRNEMQNVSEHPSRILKCFLLAARRWIARGIDGTAWRQWKSWSPIVSFNKGLDSGTEKATMRNEMRNVSDPFGRPQAWSSSHVDPAMGDDVYRFGLGDGRDTVIETAGGDDRLEFGAGIGAADVMSRRVGQDIVLTLNGGADSVTMKSWAGGDAAVVETVTFADGTRWDVDEIKRQSVIGGDAADRLEGFAGADTLIGNGGNDWLAGMKSRPHFDRLRTGFDRLRTGYWRRPEGSAEHGEGSAGQGGRIDIGVAANDDSFAIRRVG